MIKTILLATDLSLYTSCLLQHASELSKQHNAKLIILHAVEPLGSLGHALLNAYLKPETTQHMTTTGLVRMMDEVKAQVIDQLTEEHLGGSVDLLQLGQVIVRTGMPADVILAVTEEEEVDMIILGSHSPQMDDHHDLGSVAQKVIKGANVPVYVIPHRPLGSMDNAINTQMGLW